MYEQPGMKEDDGNPTGYNSANIRVSKYTILYTYMKIERLKTTKHHK
jgi:hypothetical protein